MSDHITRVREQAEKASREAYGFNGVRGHDSRNGTRRKAFIAGAVWAASRVTPTREQIAKALRRHNFDELLLGNIEWDGYTAVCACGWSSEECKMPGDAHEAHIEHAAAHVLALMAELAEGDS